MPNKKFNGLKSSNKTESKTSLDTNSVSKSC